MSNAVIYLLLIIIAMIFLSVSVYSKVKKRRIISVSAFSIVALSIIVIRYHEAGGIFIKQDIFPLIITIIILFIVYLILDYIDKKFPEENKEDMDEK